jgi:dTDP-4-amino-4,6-dideoxygalactose transaminase
MVLMGPEVRELESRFREYFALPHALAVNNGTAALYMALRALEIGSGDDVIVPAISWIATANAVAIAGAAPVFADLDEDANLDAESVRSLISPRTRAIMPVHLYGKMCRMDRLAEVAEAHGLKIVEDASQAFGSAYKGVKAGCWGDLGCFSLNAMKNFGAFGDSGLVVTRDAACHKTLETLRYNGTIDKIECVTPSLNFKPDTLQAALMLVKFRHFDRTIARKRRIAALYDAALNGVVETPRADADDFHTYYAYTIRTPERDRLRAFLEAEQIETRVQHAPLMALQPPYRSARRAPLPRAERIVGEILSLPCHDKLTDEEVDRVIHAVRRFFKSSGRVS